MAEVSQDYGEDFKSDDRDIPGFRCTCGSRKCRDQGNKPSLESERDKPRKCSIEKPARLLRRSTRKKTKSKAGKKPVRRRKQT